MKRVLPIIVTLVLLVGLWKADPVRRADPMIEPAPLTRIDFPAVLGPWRLETLDGQLPKAFPPHNEVAERVAVYQSALVGDAPAYVRVVVAQDRRDLLAYEPTHAMQKIGWSPVVAEQSGDLWHTRHLRPTTLLDRAIDVHTAFVLPGTWGPEPSLHRSLDAAGPGWPGPGAIVQVIIPDGLDAEPMLVLTRDLASSLAQNLESAAP